MDEISNEVQMFDILLESIVSYYKAIASKYRLKILFALRCESDGVDFQELKKLTRLSDRTLKKHIDILMKQRVIEIREDYYRITESGLELLTQVDEVKDAMKEILKKPEAIEELLANVDSPEKRLQMEQYIERLARKLKADKKR